MTEAKHKNVFTALSAAQSAMEPVIKGAVNPAFKGEGKPKGTAYADLSDVVSAVRPALVENGLAFFHQIIRLENGALDMRTSLVHGESDTRIDCDVPLIVAKNDMQGMKSATTYAKRIGLESVTGIAPEDDDGNAAAKAAPKNEEPRKHTAQDAVKSGPTAVQIAAESLSNADTLDQLAAIWKDIPRSVQGDAAVIKAKDDRKSALQNADLGKDEIPY